MYQSAELCFLCRATLVDLWCVRRLQGGSSWPGSWVGVSAAPRSTDPEFIPASPDSVAGFWATQIPASSKMTPSLSPPCQPLWRDEAWTVLQDPAPQLWMCGLHLCCLVGSTQSQISNPSMSSVTDHPVWSVHPVVNCSGNFQCSSTSCINKINPECDGVPDCPNQADETNCGESVCVFRGGKRTQVSYLLLLSIIVIILK